MESGLARFDDGAATASADLARSGLASEVHRLIRLPALGGPRGSLARRPPVVHIRHVHAPMATWGESEWVHGVPMITLNVWDGQLVEETHETLLHELVHVCRGGRCWDHYGEFKTTLTQAAYEAWGVDVRDKFNGRSKTRDIDRAITAGLLRKQRPMVWAWHWLADWWARFNGDAD